MFNDHLILMQEIILMNKEYDPIKYLCYYFLKKELDSGRIIRPNTCSICENKSNRIISHHNDYLLPLKVIWVCFSCHQKIHKKDLRFTEKEKSMIKKISKKRRKISNIRKENTRKLISEKIEKILKKE